MKSAGTINFGTASAVRLVAAVAAVLGLVTAITAQTARAEIAIASDAEASGRDGEACCFSSVFFGGIRRRLQRARQEVLRSAATTIATRIAPAASRSTSFDIAKAGQEADVSERMIRKLQASMMPPPGMPRPEPAAYQGFIRTLETAVDAHAKANPNPGGRTFQRLNRPEYARAVKDLLDLDVDPGKWLPLDTMSANFDNIADEQTLSPTLLEAYLNAAADISRMAVGDKSAPSIDTTYTNPTYMSQHPWDRVEGAPFGTRGGMVVNHVFPADGEYQFEMTFNSGENTRFEDIDISIDGERVALVAVRVDQHRRRRRPRPDAAAHRADPRQGRPAQGRRRVRQEDRRSVRRPDSPARLVVRGRRFGRRRHHHAAAHGRPRRPRADQDDRHLDDAEPAEDFHVPSDLAGDRARLRAADHRARSAAKRIVVRCRRRKSIA